MMETEATLTWEQLEFLRPLFSARVGKCSASDVSSFCCSLTSEDDVKMLRDIIVSSPMRAADLVITDLFCLAGIGDFADLFRARIRALPGESVADIGGIFETWLVHCAKDLFDVNALRLLYEFGDGEIFAFPESRDDIRDRLPTPDCFLWSRREQVTQFLARLNSEQIGKRELALCRNFLTDTRVNQLLLREAKSGSVTSLATLALNRVRFPWAMLAGARPSDQHERAVLRNLIMENIKRGERLNDARKVTNGDVSFYEIVEAALVAERLNPQPVSLA